MNKNSDAAFTGSIPEVYDNYLVPLIFESYAVDMAARVVQCGPTRILEVAAGTGALTRELAMATGSETFIMATDLNQAMLDQAIAKGTARQVEWRQADVMDLPFPDQDFDVVCCQFGAMFFPDKPKAFAEVRRVLRDNGCFIFSVWDGLEDNEFPRVVSETLAALFPENPPQFLLRGPYGYYDRNLISQDLTNGGFETVADFATVTRQSHAKSAQDAASGFCQGSPLRSEIVSRGENMLRSATSAAASAIAERFGNGPIQGKIQATLVTVRR